MPRYTGKVCRYCGVQLTQLNTNKGRLEHRDYKCKQCERTQSHKQYHENPAKHAEYARASSLKGRYGISIEEYDRMFMIQSGLCAICHKPETNLLHGSPRRLAVDHNHSTGQIRALLCTKCNAVLGWASEDADVLRAAAEYIERLG